MKDEDKEHGPIAWMAGNPVAANLLMLVLLIGGLMILPQIRQEVFPEFDLDLVSISVAYPGAAPSEVEQGIPLALVPALYLVIEDLQHFFGRDQAGPAA